MLKWRLVDVGSIGITPSSRPSNFLACVLASFTRMQRDRNSSSILLCWPSKGGSSGRSIMSKISPLVAPLVTSTRRSVSKLLVTITFMPTASSISCGKSFESHRLPFRFYSSGVPIYSDPDLWSLTADLRQFLGLYKQELANGFLCTFVADISHQQFLILAVYSPLWEYTLRLSEELFGTACTFWERSVPTYTGVALVHSSWCTIRGDIYLLCKFPSQCSVFIHDNTSSKPCRRQTRHSLFSCPPMKRITSDREGCFWQLF